MIVCSQPSPKVVDVVQRLGADVFDHLVETRLARIEKVFGPISFWIERAPSNIAGTNLVQMTVGPTHRCLDRKMQAIESDIEWDFDAAQNHGLDGIEGDLEAGNGDGAHAANLRRSLSLAQFHGKSSLSLWIL